MAKEVQLYDFYKSNGGDHRTFTDGPSLTRQEFADECDINSLMSRYDAHVTGGPGGLRPQEPMYGDFASMPTNLLEYMQFMDMAQAEFMKLPAVVRREFDNSAHEFVAFASDPGNLDQMREWGLAPPAKAPDAPAPIVSGPAPAPGAAPQAPAAAPGGPSTHG